MQDDEVEIKPGPVIQAAEVWRAIDWNDPRLIWKHVGIPESLHDMCALLGIIVRDDPKRTHGVKKADYVPRPEDFLIYLPLLDDPTQCAILPVPPGIEGDRESWLDVLSALADFRVASRART